MAHDKQPAHDDLLPTAAPRDAPSQKPGSTGGAGSLVRFAALVIIIAALSLARDVLIPLALSMLLCFALAPLVMRLRRWGLARIPAVALAVLLAAGSVTAIGGFMVMQVIDITMRLPGYQGNIEHKIESLRLIPNGPLDRAFRMFTRLSAGIDKVADGTSPGLPPDTLAPAAASTQRAEDGSPPGPAASQPAAPGPAPAPTPVSILRDVMGTALGPLETAGIVFVLVIFMLIEREELRNRLIRALGTAPGQLNTTTQALDDAARRVSRYLLMQLVVNLTFGVLVGIGLQLIGVPNAALWGLLAAMLRFIPYVGMMVASALPTAIAFAVDPGWGMVIETVLLFIVIEIICSSFVEPWLYGTSVGVSSVAILVSAVFWAWLWGPIGLLMSMPLTVCLVVVGRYIPVLHGLSLMLGDQPGLPLYARMYQRFLAMDPDEPDQIAREYLGEHTLAEFYGQVMLSTLRLLEDERHQETLEPARRSFILEHIRELIEDVADHADPQPDTSPGSPAAPIAGKDEPPSANATDAMPGAALPMRDAAAAPAANAIIACIPAHDESDEIVALMISILLRRHGVAASVISADQSSAERIEKLETLAASITCISVLPPYAVVYARHTVQRIRRRLPAMRLVVGFWETSAASTDLTRQLEAAGADEVVWSVSSAVESLLAQAAAASAPPRAASGPEKPAARPPSTLNV